MAVIKIPDSEKFCPKCGRRLLLDTKDGKPVKRCVFEGLIFVVDSGLNITGSLNGDGEEE